MKGHSALRDFYDQGETPLFQELLERVNRQAIGPFFRSHLRRHGKILDAGSGTGSLANEVGLYGGYFIDMAWSQVHRFIKKGNIGFFVQADLKDLPFEDGSFDSVICSNVLHYTGLAGLKEILRVTKKGGQVLLAFLEDSDFTRAGIRVGVFMGLFPSMMLDAKLINLSEFHRLGVKIKDSATVSFFPPIFKTSRDSERVGLVAYELEKY